jgi:putative Mg2+ transporter-C (MgtC) family protein
MHPSEMVLRLLLAGGLGAVLGTEREFRRKPAGLRTNILIAIGAALFTMTSITFAGAGGSSDRVAAQVVTGIGFLGAGTILRFRGSVHGMTTAATIWVNAAIGMTAGIGAFSLAVTATVITLIVLLVLPFFESWFENRPVKPKRVKLVKPVNTEPS